MRTGLTRGHKINQTLQLFRIVNAVKVNVKVTSFLWNHRKKTILQMTQNYWNFFFFFTKDILY